MPRSLVDPDASEDEEVKVVPYTAIMTLTSAQPEDWLFPVYPVRYPAAFSLVNMMLLLSHWSVSRRGSSCSASPAPSTSSPS